MSEPDWEDLRHFNALAEKLNLAAAAAALRTSQVTVMRRVKTLERTLGATLFLRRRDGHRLTPAGADLLHATTEAAEAIRQGRQRVAARDGKAEGRVRITTTELAANWILLPRLPSFLSANPGLRFEIDASPAPQDLTQETDALAIRFRRPDAGPYQIKKLAEIAFGLYRRADPPPRQTDTGYIGWSGAFEDIGLSRWLRRIHDGTPPTLALTTFAGHLDAARLGLGAVGLPTFIGAHDPMFVRVADAAEAFKLEAWLVAPAQIAAATRIRRAMQFVVGAFAHLPA